MADTGKKLSIITLQLVHYALAFLLIVGVIDTIANGGSWWPIVALFLAMSVTSLVKTRLLKSLAWARALDEMGGALDEDEPVAMWRAEVGDRYIDFVLTRSGDYRWTIPVQWSNDFDLTGSIAEEALGQLQDAMGSERSFAREDFWSSSIRWTPELPSGQPPD